MTEVIATQEPIGSKAGIRASLERTFDRYLVPVLPANNESPRIVSVGCQLGYEAVPLVNLYPNANFLGIDINPDDVFGAIVTNKDSGENVEFKEGDATNKETFGNDPIDLVVLRHPQVTLEPWRTIIANSISALKPDGVVYSSTDSEWEQQEIIRQLEAGGLEVIHSGKNDMAEKEDTQADKIVIIAKKNGI